MVASKDAEILIVEDNPNDKELTIRALKQANVTNEIRVATDGAEALDLFFGKGAYADVPPAALPRVILLDLKLPKVDGLEVLRRLKADERTKVVPVVVLSSSSEESDRVASYHYGVNSYIVKPVDSENFFEAVKTVGLYWLLLNEPPH
jgi:CheY-like chemotaxis protein